MAADPQKLRFLMFSYLVILSVCDQCPTNFIYNGFNGSKLHLDGIANIHSNGLWKLTNSSELQKGHVFFPFPLRMSASPKLSTTFSFAMYPHHPNGGHGIAFVLSPSINFSPALANEYLGLFNDSRNGLSSNHIFAVELDTVKSPMFADIDDNHVGVDVNNLTSVDSAPEQYYSNQERKTMSLNLMSGKAMQVGMDYDANESLVEVAIAPLGQPKPKLLLLSTRVNLSEILLDAAYVGFSASTGLLTSDQYLLGWSFNTNGKAGNLDLSKLPSLPKERKKVSHPLKALITSKTRIKAEHETSNEISGWR